MLSREAASSRIDQFMGNSQETDESKSEWAWSKTHQALVRIVESIDLWDLPSVRIWLPDRDAIVQVPANDLLAPSHAIERKTVEARLRYLLMAARLSNLLTEDVLLAPIDASVIPLPHQIRALRKAISRDRVRFLLADEVGLGKTIEAGLILRELKLRGLVTRSLVISPRGLIMQWIAEMKTHFGEKFRHFQPADFPSYRRIAETDNIWQAYPQIICSLDAVKPLESRKGWSREQLDQHNQDRFLDLISAGWDLIIVDEAHRMGGSTAQVARHQLGKGLAEAAPYLLLLSATPHQGKSDAFHRLLTLLDRDAFPDPSSVVKERVLPYVIRTEKRQAIDADGKPLFKPRVTKMVTIPWKTEHESQRQLYESVTEYVRAGYNRALREKKGYLGFLMILMQRLVTSSTRSITTTLARRMDALNQSVDSNSRELMLFDDDWGDLDGQAQLEDLLASRSTPLDAEKEEVRHLLDLAFRVEAQGPDARADALLEWIYTLQKEEGEPDLKILIFTEFIPTQEMLAEFLTVRGFSVVCLNGSMDMDQRNHVQDCFAGDVRILISTDAGGEGLNLQFCHVVINYDLPWNPMRLEQRIGRVDRIGQTKIVRAMNFVLEDTIECRVQEVLEEKLSIILDEFGVDKTGDVLDTIEAGAIFDKLYLEALLHPEHISDTVQRAAATVQEEASRARAQQSLFDDPVALDTADAMKTQQLPIGEWIEAMTSNYLDAHGGSLKHDGAAFQIRWPNEQDTHLVAFPGRQWNLPAGVDLLSLEHPRVRGVITHLPRQAPGCPIECITLDGIPDEINGFWSLWKIGMLTSDRRRQRILPVFVHDDGRALQPTARYLWEELNINRWQVNGAVAGGKNQEAFRASMAAAMEQGREVFMQLRQRHLAQLNLENDKAEYSFRARRK
ncbi:MAG: helicase-related protein, partial [Pseudomonadota bacterium]